MTVTETLNQGLKRELEIVIPADEIGQKFDTYLDELKNKANLKGFRPGKVPVAHLRRLLGKDAMGEIVNEMIGDTVRKTLEEREEKPAMQPDLDFDEERVKSLIETLGGELSFKMKYDVLPTIELTDFGKIEIERPVVDVADTDVDERIEQIASSSRPFEAKDDGAAAEDGDRITMAYVGKVDGEAFDGGSDENGQLVLGSGQFIPGFEDQLIGAKEGEERAVTVTFPEAYQAAHLAGKEAVFDVTVKEIAAPGELEINDEFATGLGLESLDKLKEAVREQIVSEFGQLTRQKVKRQLLDQLDEAHKFDLPESLVDSEFESVWKQITDDMERTGQTFEDGDKSEDDARKEYREISERRVRLGLVLSEIGEANTIEVTEDEVQRAMYDRLRQFPGQEQQVYDYYQKNPEAMASLRAPIYEEKVVDFLVELAKVTDKTVDKDTLINDPDAQDPDQDQDG